MIRPDADATAPGQHEAVWELLPWYVNGTLQAPELNQVERHLAACGACREELTRCRELATAVQATRDVAWSPTSEHFSRLLSRIDAAEAGSRREAVEVASSREVAEVARTEPGIWGGRLRAWLVRSGLWLSGTPGPLRWALITQGALIVLLVGVVAWQASLLSAPYQTLSRAGDQASLRQAWIRVVFTDDITAGELRMLLGSVGGRIVDGPSPVGVYTVAVSGGASAVLETVRAHPKVRLAEPVHNR
jgi:anti-sigma factor RsiW